VVEPVWNIHAIDCVKGMSQLASGKWDLVATDPPYNLGRDYDIYEDRKSTAEYLNWARQWLGEIHRVLHKHGSFWLAMGAGLVSELDVMCKKDFKFYKRGHIIWAFTFGVNNPKNFTRAHTHWLYYTKSKTRFTFNAQDPAVRVPSARQLIYGDKRANPKGRLPDDVWVLRPPELAECFSGKSDVWLQSRVCGTFHERVKGADNQIPLAMMERIVRTCSKPGDMVLDPFAGTGTTGVAAVMAGCNFQGFDVSKAYVDRACSRVTAALNPVV